MGAVVKDTTRLKTHRKVKVIIKGMFLYSAQSLGLFIALYTSPPGRPVHSNAISTSLEAFSHAAITAQRLFVHKSTSVCIQVLIYTAE